jgi:pimeloyl-ACP methyl ester carboxylesterase
MRTIVLILFAISSALASSRVEEGRFKTPDGVELFYQKVGSGKQVVIIPGGLFSFDGLKPLANKDRTVIFYDMRNRGRSQHIDDMSKITIEGDVADLEAVRAHFKAQKFTPIGYSYLGMMVMLYAKDHPDRVERVVQLGPVPLKFGTEYPAEFDNTRDRSVVDGAKYAELERLEKQGLKEKEPQIFCEKSTGSKVFVRIPTSGPSTSTAIYRRTLKTRCRS